MNAASLPHEKVKRAIELIASRVAPLVRDRLGAGGGPRPNPADRGGR